MVSIVSKQTFCLKDAPIAIIGMSSMMPISQNLQEFWDNILNEADCITDVPNSRWAVEDYFDPDPSAIDKTYCRRGGFLPDIEFDPTEFGLPPNILEVTDISQLLALITARDAFAHAGYLNHPSFNTDRTGVILGTTGAKQLTVPLTVRLQYPIWDRVLKQYGINDVDRTKIIDAMKAQYIDWKENSFPGLLGNVVAGRIANRFNLGGTNCIVDAACASSLSAIQMSISQLIEGRCDMMLTGGVDTDNSILLYMCFSKTPAFSQQQQTRPFDENSDGILIGEGIGMLVLKRLDDAERDNDTIYAIIRGIGSSSDGRSKSIYAPLPEGQFKALTRAYEDAGFPFHQTALIETHGTGTVAGDLCEITALKHVYEDSVSTHPTDLPNRPHIAIGSIKSQIGHTKATAGAAGLIKAALALHERVLPATINVTKPNPKFGLEHSNFYINSETRPWFASQHKKIRRAGLSSFGFGGTNFHVVLEEYPTPLSKYKRIQPKPYSIFLQESDLNSLKNSCQQWIDSLSQPDANAWKRLAEQSAQTIANPKQVRLGFLAQTAEEALEKFQKFLQKPSNSQHGDVAKDTDIFLSTTLFETPPLVAALFPGQGSQYLNMGKELTINFPEVMKCFEDINTLFDNSGREPITDVVYPIPSFDQQTRDRQLNELMKTQNTQPAIGALSAGMYQVLKQAGFQPAGVAGHSFGELTALWAAGMISESDFHCLAKLRGEVMARATNSSTDTGRMLAIQSKFEEIQLIVDSIKDLWIANINSQEQIIAAGSSEAIQEIKNRLSQQSIRYVEVPVAGAFHTPILNKACEEFAENLNEHMFGPPQIPVYSNTNASPYSSHPQAILETLRSHMVTPVRFLEMIEAMYQNGIRIFVEVGPKNILTKLMQTILKDKPVQIITTGAQPSRDSDRQFREAALLMRVSGIPMTEIDPYLPAIPKTTSTRKKNLSVLLNGNNYVSPQKQEAASLALEQCKPSLESFHPEESTISTKDSTFSEKRDQATEPPISLTAPLQDKSIPESKQREVMAMQNQRELTNQQSSVQIDSHEPVYTAIGHIHQIQQQTIETHKNYLQNQSEYINLMKQLMQQQHQFLESGCQSHEQVEAFRIASEGLVQSFHRFHDNQLETQHVHKQYLQNQLSHSELYYQLANGNSASFHTNTRHDNDKNVIPRMSQPTFERPASETIDYSPKVSPTLPGQQPDRFPDPPPPTNGDLPPEDSNSLPSAVTQETSLNIDIQDILEIVSEKTGYPVDLIEVDMDMEADLGIDSIKRVEILGSMQDRFPNLPAMNPEDLAELKTLQEIFDYMNSSNLTSDVVQHRPQNEINNSVKNQHLSPVEQDISIQSQSASSRPEHGLKQIMISVISEKTGYPEDMIELDMDMEADLGIDSIKRVEILGTIQDQIPDLPAVNPEDLAERKTLQEIIDYMSSGETETIWREDITIQETHNEQSNIHSYEVGLSELPQPDFYEYGANAQKICLLVSNETVISGELVKQFNQDHWSFILLNYAHEHHSPSGDTQFRLKNLDEDEIKHCLQEIKQIHGGFNSVVYLHGVNSNEDEDFNDFAFLLIKHTIGELQAQSDSIRTNFVSVTKTDGQLSITGQHENYRTSGLNGIMKSMQKEHPEVFWRLLDVASLLSEHEIAKQIYRELHDTNRSLVEVGWDGQSRVTLEPQTWVQAS